MSEIKLNIKIENMGIFPNCFPENFERDLLPRDCEFHSYTAHRILKRGILDRKAFVSTFEEYRDSKWKPSGYDLNSPDTYSTSVFQKFQDARKLLKVICRHYPRPSIAVGTTDPSCGPCKKSNNRRDSHIHWWIFEDASPEKFFEVLEQS